MRMHSRPCEFDKCLSYIDLSILKKKGYNDFYPGALSAPLTIFFSFLFFFARRRNEALVTSVIAGQLREFISLAANTRAGLTVRGGEVVLDAHLPPQRFAKGCKVRAETRGVRAVATVRRGTVLRATAGISHGNGGGGLGDEEEVMKTYKNIVGGGGGGGRGSKQKEKKEKDDDDDAGDPGEKFKEGVDSLLRGLRSVRASLFLGGDIEVGLYAESEVGARIGKELFGRCLTKYRKTLPLRVKSSGKVWLGAQVVASDVRIEERPKGGRTLAKDKNFFFGGGGRTPAYSAQDVKGPTGETQKFLVFKLDIRLSGRVVSWSLDHLHVKNCDLR